MMRAAVSSSLFFLICFLIQVSQNRAQFGFPKRRTDGDAKAGSGSGGQQRQQEATIGANGEIQIPKEVSDLASKLMTVDADLKEQDAVDIATLMDAARKDEETKIMLLRMKTEEPEAFEGPANSSPLEILKGVEQAFEELKMLDYLFQDKERALREMEKEGMIPKEKFSIYKKDPDLLEADTRKGLYFMFVALAEAAGYL